eukprot:CAMPEP_0118644180 /NCGR_PEP_ID=MMETSP0785-20121206/6798_1 /TAXON_ID=91992 /ORGANISM="Bolidomonas pacifica, Strain CCMP 1866" /LENGTH=716 /DNA_ID=CAMNT_0006535915 /DNA_START=100 /DNA_END=2246 /DNA_ORIENTATION=-
MRSAGYYGLLSIFLFICARASANDTYTVRACVAKSLKHTCTLNAVTTRFTEQPVKGDNCDPTQDQGGSVTWADLTIPDSGGVLMVEVTTSYPDHTSNGGFYVRPSRRTRQWGRAQLSGGKTATFYLAETGQYSVEFASQAFWRTNAALSFDALMLFVNPELSIPSTAKVISDDTTEAAVDLGPNEVYVFAADYTYDWGRDHVFKVHDNTQVFFEPGAHVRARIVQTEKKVDNVLISGYGILDAHYDLEPDVVGISDDNTHQNIGIYGKNIRVHGVTILNTNPKCHAWGYCLNINANWSPIGDPSDPFGADELQDQTLPAPSYKPRQAHCQEKNMDDSPNTNFQNCPTSHDDGQEVTFVKCMTWQMGQDGINAGKYGTVDNSFVRVIDDALKPWDSNGVYTNVTIWQQTLGWPINFGWWNWNQADENTLLEDIYVIHNHNWHSSAGWPETMSGQCTIGAIYGSGAVKKNYKLKNIFVETAASCAVGLEISKTAYNRHPTSDGCVGSMIDFEIDGLFFDEDFKTGSGYDNFISGETNPYPACTGELSGKVEGMKISSNIAGKALAESDFVIPASDTVSGLVLTKAVDPKSNGSWGENPGKNAYVGKGAAFDIDSDGVVVAGLEQCLERCYSDLSCDCAVYKSQDGSCWKRRGCEDSSIFETSVLHDVYVYDGASEDEGTDNGEINDEDDAGNAAITTNPSAWVIASCIAIQVCCMIWL